jgi:hypothetical protein
VVLIGSDSRISDASLREILVEHLEAVRELAERLGAPRFAVTDPSRIELARSFATNLLAFLDAPAASSLDREALRLRVNASYELMLVLIDYSKLFTDAPKVPRGTATAKS